MINALILTYNEEGILPQCLSALDFVSEILVFDSFSTDNTVSIANSMGAKVIQRTFDNYSNQRNEALKAVSPDSDWILMVDADEIVTPELKKEILDLTSQPDNQISLYHVRRKDMFENKWIKHSSGYPTWFGRLFRTGKVWVEREVNEEYHTSGKVGYLQQHLIHFPFNKGIAYWFEKHNRYSSMEAENAMLRLDESSGLKDLFSVDPTKRRKKQKSIMIKFPFRPQTVFLLFYVLRMGFLDGREGYTFCKLRKTYEWMIELKIKEIQLENRS